MQLRKRSCLITTIMRAYCSSSRMNSNHYQALGLTPKATQNDIKSAYYNLSMQHHPDKSNEESSTKKFRAITEAYEVLGNVRLKKIYDKGLLQGVHSTTTVYHPEPEPQDPTLRFYKSRTNRQAMTTMDGKTPIYDFDAWSKHHYSESFIKKREGNIKKEMRKATNLDSQDHGMQVAYIYLLAFLFASLFMVTMLGEADYDVTTKTNNTKQSSSKPT